MSERNNTPVQEEVQTGESLSELLQIRRNKLNDCLLYTSDAADE